MDSILGLIGNAKSAVDAVLKAIEELENAPKKLEDLASQVSETKQIVERLEQALTNRKLPQSSEEFLRSALENLDRELKVAGDKIKRYREKRHGIIRKMVTTVAGHGAAKQNIDVTELAQRIRDVSRQLSDKLQLETFFLVARSEPEPRRRDVPALIQKLDELAMDCLDSEECKVSVQVGEVHGTNFTDAVQQAQNVLVDGKDDETRAAIQGGYEVKNFSKVRFEISVTEKRYFYVVTYDPDEETPVLFHPRSRSANNGLNEKYDRLFPDQTKSKHDPLSFRIGSDDASKSLRQQLVYFLLPLEPIAGNSKTLQLNDIHTDDDLFVIKFIFDVV